MHSKTPVLFRILREETGVFLCVGLIALVRPVISEQEMKLYTEYERKML